MRDMSLKVREIELASLDELIAFMNGLEKNSFETTFYSKHEKKGRYGVWKGGKITSSITAPMGTFYDEEAFRNNAIQCMSHGSCIVKVDSPSTGRRFIIKLEKRKNDVERSDELSILLDEISRLTEKLFRSRDKLRDSGLTTLSELVKMKINEGYGYFHRQPNARWLRGRARELQDLWKVVKDKLGDVQ